MSSGPQWYESLTSTRTASTLTASPVSAMRPGMSFQSNRTPQQTVPPGRATPQQQSRTQYAMHSGNGHQYGQAAHNITGTSSSVVIQSLQQQLEGRNRELEAARHRDADRTAAFSRLENVVHELRTALNIQRNMHKEELGAWAHRVEHLERQQRAGGQHPHQRGADQRQKSHATGMSSGTFDAAAVSPVQARQQHHMNQSAHGARRPNAATGNGAGHTGCGSLSATSMGIERDLENIRYSLEKVLHIDSTTGASGGGGGGAYQHKETATDDGSQSAADAALLEEIGALRCENEHLKLCVTELSEQLRAQSAEATKYIIRLEGEKHQVDRELRRIHSVFSCGVENVLGSCDAQQRQQLKQLLDVQPHPPSRPSPTRRSPPVRRAVSPVQQEVRVGSALESDSSGENLSEPTSCATSDPGSPNTSVQ